jgi:DNA-binding NarL/FixJ family response regulator
LEYDPLRKVTTELEASRIRLTTRELEVLHLLSVGKSSKQIGDSLQISCRTVETHRANVMRKFNVHSVTELLHFAFANELMQVENTISDLSLTTTFGIGSASIPIRP